MRTWLSRRIDYPLIGFLFGEEAVVMAMTYGGMLFDLLIMPLLMWRPTRIAGFAGVLFFNFTNAITFNIGIFPWLSTALSTVFFDPGWPRRYVVLKEARATAPVGAARGRCWHSWWSTSLGSCFCR